MPRGNRNDPEESTREQTRSERGSMRIDKEPLISLEEQLCTGANPRISTLRDLLVQSPYQLPGTDTCCAGFGFSTTLQMLAVPNLAFLLLYMAFLQLCRFFGFSTILLIFAVPDMAFLQFCRFLLYWIWLFYGFSTILLIFAVLDT